MQHEESIIQSQIVSALSISGIFVFMVPNDAAGKISKARACRLKACGLRAGISDLILIGADCRAYFMEVKTPTGRLSESQSRFRDLCEKKAWPYSVVRSVEEALDVCRKWCIL